METSIFRKCKELKEKYPDAVILFRTGDFYTTFNSDAEVVNKVLGVPLEKIIVTRGCTNRPKAMAKFPCCEIDTYIPKLVKAGHRIALCDLLEAPKKLVKRGSQELTK